MEVSTEIHLDLERQRTFDSMAPHWDAMVPQPPREKIRELIELAGVAGKTVLDVGAGTGVLVEEGLAAGPERWIACDLSRAMLRVLEDKYQARAGDGAAASDGRLVLLHADVHHLPLESLSVDRVICHNAFPHFRQPRIALGVLFRVLRPGGLLVINHFTGRETLNQVHRSAAHAVLRGDLLAPAEEVAGWLREGGFTVGAVVDSPELYRIVAVRPPYGGSDSG
ncbi:MAG: class I SAM-dependent methyltransferase [Peptococcaceae bacterium]|nr:class I SAM-dependent methyltransferase [Peptococcaceae bacterium]